MLTSCQARLAEAARTEPLEPWALPKCIRTTAERTAKTEDGIEALRRLAASEREAPFVEFFLGQMEGSWGEKRQAAAAFGRAAALFGRRGQPRWKLVCLINQLKSLSKDAGQEEAAGLLREAAEVARDLGDDELTAQVEVQRAWEIIRSGRNLGEARTLLQEVEAIAFPGGSYELRRDTLQARARVAFALGRMAEALRHQQRLAELARDQKQQGTLTRALVDILVARLAQWPRRGTKAELSALAEEALAAAEDGGYPATQARLHRILGKLKGGPGGEEHLLACGELARRSGVASEIVYCLTARAAVAARHDPPRARRLLDEALALAAQSGDPWSPLYSWPERLEVAWRTQPGEVAIGESLALLEEIEAQRSQQRGEAERAEHFTLWNQAYAAVAGRLLAAGGEVSAGPRSDGEPSTGVELAFGLIEHRQARVLLESLRASGAATGAPAAIAGQRRGFASLDAVAGALLPDEALLEFQLAPEENIYGFATGGSWLLAVTREGHRVYRLPDLASADRLEAFPDLLRKGEEPAAAGAARLHRELLARALADLPPAVQRLVVVPDGALHRLPLAALRATPEAEPLVARYQLTVVPSATLWLEWRARSAARQSARSEAAAGGALVLADPRPLPPPPAPGPLLAGSPLTAAEPSPPAPTATGLGPLPAARREGRAVIARLGDGRGLRPLLSRLLAPLTAPAGPGGRLLVGEAATEAALLEAAARGDFGILHLAAHAVVDPHESRRSAVLLAPGGGQDGRLEPEEIARLPLAGRLVVLSACDSAAGELLAGEGVLSLGRAFFQAGALAVVGSQWRLPDDETARLFDRFYRHLADGESAAAALAAAQRESRQAGAPAAAWAGLVVLGEGEATPLPAAGAETRSARSDGARGDRARGDGGPLVLLLLAALVALPVLVLAIRGRRGRRG